MGWVRARTEAKTFAIWVRGNWFSSHMHATQSSTREGGFEANKFYWNRKRVIRTAYESLGSPPSSKPKLAWQGVFHPIQPQFVPPPPIKGPYNVTLCPQWVVKLLGKANSSLLRVHNVTRRAILPIIPKGRAEDNSYAKR